MGQELSIGLTILLCGLVISGAFLYVFGYLMPRNLKRAFDKHIVIDEPDEVVHADPVNEVTASETSLAMPAVAQLGGADATNPVKFRDLYFIRCERGPDKDRQPLDDEWEASFSLIFSASPDDIWKKFFAGLRSRHYRNRTEPTFSSGYIYSEKLIFYCYPRQLQRVVDWLSRIVNETNQLYRRRLAQAEIWPTEEAEFEEMIETALSSLVLPRIETPEEEKDLMVNTEGKE